jgi:hypothetical protein
MSINTARITKTAAKLEKLAAKMRAALDAADAAIAALPN